MSMRWNTQDKISHVFTLSIIFGHEISTPTIYIGSYKDIIQTVTPEILAWKYREKQLFWQML